ncbi:MAG: flippase [Mucilaginibacter polytrichastri]|nr:flippase [Mucilaginibacter polytrichastri]
MKIALLKGFDQQALMRYAKNTSWLFAGRIGSLVIKMLIGIAVQNYLRPEQNGILEYANAFVVLVLPLAALGLDSFTVRELVRSPDERNRILGTAFWLKLIGGLSIIPVIAAGYYFFGQTETPYIFVLIISFAGIFQTFTIIDSFFQSRVEGKFIMQATVIANLITAVIRGIFIMLEMPIEAFIWMLLLDYVLLALGYIIVYQRRGFSVPKWAFDRQKAGFLLKKSWPLMFSAILVSLYMRIDVLMIGNMLGEDQLGIYATVVRFSEVWYFIPMAIVTSVFPAIINAKIQDEKRYQKRLQNMYDLMVVISVGIAVVMTFGSDLLYHIAYRNNPAYFAGADVLKIHIWAGVFVFLGSASGQYLINEGLTQLSLLRTAMGALVNVVLNLILLPRMGIVGAAWATLAAYFTATFFIVFVPKTSRQALLMLKSLFLISIIQNLRKR